MKDYDDLQRFKEKTQMQGINFRDMSGQSLDNDQQRWSIIQQLADKKNGDDVLETGQRIDRTQPQPVKSDAFSMPAVAYLPAASASVAKSRGSSLLDSVAASLKPADAPAQRPAPSTGSLLQQIPVAPAAPKPVTVTSLAPSPVAASAPVQQAVFNQPASARQAAFNQSEAPSRFGGLFRTRPTGPVMLPKDTLLKPLLEKIALCR